MNLGRKIFPFALRRNINNEWIILNKHENPIGTDSDYKLDAYKLPVRYRLKRVGEQKLLSLAYAPEAVVRNSKGDIKYVQLYKVDADRKTPEYIAKLAILEEIQINQI